MSRNLHCNCLCHGSDGNRIGDGNFSCKLCYAAMHLGNLPRFSHEEERKPKKAARKPKVERKFEQKTPGTASMKVPVLAKGQDA